MDEQKTSRTIGRRGFLRRAGLAGASVPVLGGVIAAACNSDPSGQRADPPVLREVDHRVATPAAAAARDTTPGASANHSTAMTAAQMDDAHKKGVEDFLKNQQTPITKGKGNIPLESTMDGNVRVFNLTVDEVQWETSPGQVETARGYNKMIPGPILRATEGERVRINVTNNLAESTSVHWHGLLIPNNMDGVPYINQDPITPGGTFVYEFTLRNSGTHMYHSHHNSMDQVNRGLLGAFIVDPRDPARAPKYDREYILVMNDTMLGFTLNGKGFPATEALFAKKGERVLVRWLNEGLMNHPMHLHGMPMEVIARDGWPVAGPWLCDTLDVAPGNRYDTIIVADEPGVWAFHCHVLSHAESAQGMFGLVTALVVEE
jgi:FtsP/CotA-like multicopper oxidase with cupredoxin domain